MIRKHESLQSVAEQSDRAMRSVSLKVTRLAKNTNTSIITWDHERSKVRTRDLMGVRSNEAIKQVLAEHRDWLRGFDRQCLNAWERLLESNFEAATVEALARRLLQMNEVVVEPIPPGAEGRTPDFLCRREVDKFYVEATCIETTTATQATNIPTTPRGAGLHNSMTKVILKKSKEKATQCADRDAPTLLAFGTLHGPAAGICFSDHEIEEVLTGESYLSWCMDVQESDAVGDIEVTTDFKSAGWCKRNAEHETIPTRESISGWLFFNWDLSITRGLLHPNAKRPFLPERLPSIEFGRLEIDSSTNSLQVVWPHNSP